MFDVLTQIALILVVGIALKAFADRINFPAIVFFILGGTLLVTWNFIDLGSLQPLPELIRTLALIIVVFSSAFYLKLQEIRKQSLNIIFLATIGVLVTAMIITATTLYLLPIALVTAAFLGVLLCGTDPAAISAAFSKKQSKLTTILGAESLFNQPLTVILPLFLLDYIIRPETAWMNVPKLISLIVVGGVVGFVGAVLGQKLLNYSKAKHEEIVGLMIAIAVYVIAENLFGSGILAVVVCGLLLTSSKIPAKKWLGVFNRELAFLFTIFVFVLLGSEFSFDQLDFTKMEIFAVIAALFLGRMLMSLLILYKSDLKISDKIKIGLIAPKGIAPAALAPLLLKPGYNIIGADMVVKITYIAIIISIIFSLIILKVFVAKPTEKEEIKKEVEKKKEQRERKNGKIAEVVQKVKEQL